MTATGSTAADVFDADSLLAPAQTSSQPIVALREACEIASANLDAEFDAGTDIGTLLRKRASFVDQLLTSIWQRFDWGSADIALIAVGGYGRGELHPQSDIDLLVLLGDNCNDYTSQVEQFLTLLWDIKLDIGHSVRTVQQCVDQASDDISVATALMESRVIIGSQALLEVMHEATGPQHIWPSDEFFRAKWAEQKARHAKYADTEYNLEPNVKSSPGGLRDIQTISWIALRQYGVNDPQSLAKLGLLTAAELGILIRGRDFLWRVRYALHRLTGREEDRLLFDYQQELASVFGYEDGNVRLAIEQFMKQYYRSALALGQLNEVLTQHFDQVILRASEGEQVEELNSRFHIRNGYIEACSSTVFSKTPSALLELFVLCAQNPAIEGVHVSTIRLIREHRHLIDDNFRAEPRNRRLFMELLRSPHKLARQLRRMNRYGVLGKYLPEFGHIVGQMQHDLFHIYTVDAHTLEVVKNMRRFLYPEFSERFPVTSRVVARLPKLELLYVAGIYHDIGKGRGGDHSELGAADARTFCENHGLNTVDTNLVCWLVENHLHMSSVAQRKDISDPDVIQEFATLVGDQLHLDYLFALTVADINATNPTLWNAWRGSLLRQLYTETKRALRRGLENQVDKQEWIEQTQRQAQEQLEDRGFTADEVEDLWSESGEDYFLREKPGDIVWHTESIAQHYDKDTPLVLVRPSSLVDAENATQIFIHARSKDYLFSVIAAALEQLDLSVQDARVYNASDGMTMDTFYVLDANGLSIARDGDRIRHIVKSLSEQLKDQDRYPDIVRRRTPRQNKFFSVPTETTMTVDKVKQVSVLEIATPDRPGLLARIGKIFFEYDIELQAAKIATLGERVEDVFFVTDNQQKPIEDEARCREIEAAICRELDEQAAT
jgi:[protein-PII] uridylyltransferase